MDLLSVALTCVCERVCFGARTGEGAHFRLAQAPGERSVVHGGGMASSHGRSDLRFADWMASLPQSMHTIPLTNLAIPGRCFLFGCISKSMWVGRA